MEAQQDERGRVRVDTTINLQGVISGVIGAAGTIVAAWFLLAGDVRELKEKDKSQDSSLVRLETEVQRTRQEAKDQLREVSADVKEKLNDMGSDVKDIRKMLFDNAAGSRPDIRRWSR